MKPKYRSLTTEELQGLEKEFVDYLVVNGITAADWEKLKISEIEKSEDIITLFSDVVFEGVMRKVRFLEFISADEIRTFQCLDDKIIMMGMTSQNPNHDFTNPDFIKSAAQQAPAGIQYVKGEKSYSKTRELELFEMTQAGCYLSDGHMFKALAMVTAK